MDLLPIDSSGLAIEASSEPLARSLLRQLVLPFCPADPSYLQGAAVVCEATSGSV